MTLRNCLALALIASIAGAFIGRAAPGDARSAPPARSASPAPAAAVRAGNGCEEERTDLRAVKVQLAVCTMLNSRGLEAEPSDASDAPDATHPVEPMARPSVPDTAEIRRNRKLLDRYPEAVIVRHHDGSTGIYRPDEWPIDGDGEIVARKLPGGEIGWYAGPDAGPRSDPAAFRPSEPARTPPITWGRTPDGTVTIDGKPAPAELQRMFDGNVDGSAKP
ncbi:hypothetical protein [Sorangium cellulosum]|uniref:hypothetical protein n=1 Tax=Sorangium cellulosum TaxID=56 RepID=UPI001F1E7068|nr:hypothetical protein [Sorangium cellulosum]